MNWGEIADKCGTTAGAAAKRYSRMKQAFESGETAPESNPGSPAPKTPSKSTPRKKTAAADGEATPTPKRKRPTPKKKTSNAEPEDDEENVKIQPEDGAEQEDEEGTVQTPKKPKPTPKAKAKANDKTAAPKKPVQVKNEDDGTIMDSVEGEERGPDSRKCLSEM